MAGGEADYRTRCPKLHFNSTAPLVHSFSLRVRITDFCSGLVEQIAAGTWPTFLRHDILAVSSSVAAIFRTASGGV